MVTLESLALEHSHPILSLNEVDWQKDRIINVDFSDGNVFVNRENMFRRLPETIVDKTTLKLIQVDDLHEAIIYQSFGWDDPHMYSFHFDNIPYSKDRSKEYSCDPEQDMFNGAKPNSTKVKLKGLNLKKNQKFLFVFDFGDDHQFGINVEGFGEAEKGKEYPCILEEKGKAPRQYAN